ncbi:MAG TPA: SAM-dependent methyltransferase, partial [Coxiellaceae bacterium]|nr:SAM-dependent methyltransferase [Coxiellaceae bacterium]
MQNLLSVTDPVAKSHSEKLMHYLREVMAAQGALNFARFMELVLYAPGLGYYAAGACKIGKGGDFITAPELSAVFSCCVAQQCAQIIHNLANADILELGAGSGRMALDILMQLEHLNALPQHYFILELSPDLQERQQQLFQQQAPRFLNRVQWLNTLPKIKGIILANEV